MAKRLGLVALLAVAACSGPIGPLTGEDLATDVGCLSCHAAEDTAVAPSFTGLWGSEVLLDDGRSVTVDEVYVRRSITDPQADVVSGYSNAMPRFPLDDDEVERLVEYVRSLG